jgi:hypothetical protein
VQEVKNLLSKGGFYFSFNIDLTSSRQRVYKYQQKNPGGAPSVWDTIDKRYFWNNNICQDFFYQKVDSRWVVPLI